MSLEAAIEASASRCSVSWCAYPMPHRHTGGRPSWRELLNDPTQQLDPEGVVLASLGYPSRYGPRFARAADRDGYDAEEAQRRYESEIRWWEKRTRRARPDEGDADDRG